jgi:hypothetical protein
MPVWRAEDRAALAESEGRFADLVLERVRQRQAHRGGDLAVLDGPYGALLAVNPELAWHLHDLGRIFKTAAARGSIPDDLREWGDVVVCIETADTEILYAHIPDFVAQGGRTAAVRALLDGDEEALTPNERATARYVREVLGGAISDDSYAAFEARVGTRVAVEFTAFVTFLYGMSRFRQAAASDVARSWEAVHELVRGIEEGTVRLPPAAASIY